MLRQNRYHDNDFIHSQQELEIIQNEILISKEHGIVVGLEPHQIEKLDGMQAFIMKIIEAIPKLDNETQDYYEVISEDTDFPHSLSVVYFEGTEVTLDYWSDEVNNQFAVVFGFENDTWILKKWNAIDVPFNWRESCN